MSMDINSKQGAKVKGIFDADGNLMNGYDSQKEVASLYIQQDKIYTVYRTEIHSWYTNVYLIEFPDISFNSVHFEEYIEPKTSFIIEDMEKAFIDGYSFGLLKETITFSKYMYHKFNIDIEK